MALFEKKHFGDFISRELSDYLKENTNTTERSRVAVQHGTSETVIRSIMYRRAYLTEHNYKAILTLMRTAVDNYSKFKEATERIESALSEES